MNTHREDVDHTVGEMGASMAMAAPGLIQFDPRYRYFHRTEKAGDKVVLISGGGSGHEPAHGGYVGPGMLDAAVAGEIFSSPSQIQVYRCIKAVTGKKGALLIIKNYSGDIMNFQNAAALARLDGLTVDYVKVADDIAVKDSSYTVGRRGVAGTVFVHKIADAAAEAGLDLAEVKRIAQKAADNVASIGYATASCSVAVKGKSHFQLDDDEMEYGVGIHGEPGVQREKIIGPDELAKRMTEALLADVKARKGDRVAVIVNGFGGASLMELHTLNYHAMRELDAAGITVVRELVGNYMTSLDMAGASLTILRLDDELEKYLSAPCETAGLVITGPTLESKYVEYNRGDDANANATEPDYKADPSDGGDVVMDDSLSLRNMIFLVDKMSEIIIENESAFDELDTGAGDGDFGTSIANGFRQVKREWSTLTKDHGGSIGDFLDACSLVIMEYCGGASGPIWGFAFKHAAMSAGDKNSLTVQDMAAVLAAAAEGIRDVGERAFGRGAGVGDKTLMDALVPCAEAWQESAATNASMLEAFDRGAKAAVAGAEKTKDIVARMGRAGTVGKRSIGIPDAGAHALGVIFTEIAAALKKK